MEFFLDVDGVILDFEGSMIDFIREEYIKDLPLDYRLESWEMTDEFKALDIEAVWKKFVTSQRFSRLDLLADVKSFNQISEQYPVYLVTNVPNDQYSSRQKNLDLHNLSFKELHLAGHFNLGDKDYPTTSATIRELHDPAKRLIFLDDHPKNCKEIIQEFPDSEVFLMSRPHNKNIEDSNWIRVDDWNDFFKTVMKN